MEEEINFNIEFVKGKELKAGDLNGLSDPFVLVKPNQPGIFLPEKGIKTNYVPSTLEPEWKENFNLRASSNAKELKFEIYDYDSKSNTLIFLFRIWLK